ncbi:MAG: oligosaccharide flippase family protein [Candidatus Gracilibacteria bacterium]|nr:oligosaccharide flippase family protein [Candidatus Gracilibacteria bacterium]
MIKKQLIYGYLSQLITLIGGVFFLIFLPKSVGVENYGLFMLILTYVSLFGIFLGVPIQDAIKKELVEEKLNNKGKEIIANGYILRIVINIIFFMIFYFLYNNIEGIKDINYIYLILIFLFVNISGMPQNIFYALHDNKTNFHFVFIEYFLQIILLLIFYFTDKNLSINDIIIAFVIGYAVPTIYYSFNIFIKNKIKIFEFNYDISKTLIIRYIWLSLSSVSFILLTSIDNVMISYFFSNKELGYYNIATNIVNKSTIFTIAIVMGILPLFNINQDKIVIKELFKKYLKWIIGLNLIITITIIYLSDFGINLIYGKGFESSIKIMEILSLFPLFAVLQSFFSGILTNYGNYKTIMIISIFIAILNIILNFILVNLLGLIGISIATIISYGIWILILGLYIKNRIINN